MNIMQFQNFFQKKKQVNRYLSYQEQSSYRGFLQAVSFYQKKKITSDPLNVRQRDYSRITFLVKNTIYNSPKVTRVNSLRIDRIFYFIITKQVWQLQKPLYNDYQRELHLDAEDLFCCCKKRSNFYELWQQHKQPKTMQMNQASSDICDEEYIHQFKPE